MAYTPTHPVRFVTAASLFDGHDAAINIMRRILQAQGAEVIHLGHDRSVDDVVRTAIEEDAQGIAVSSYQGGHVEYFKYMVDLLRERGAGHIKVFGGGGGVIVPEEIAELEAYGVAKIFSPEDGMRMGLEGMIESMIRACDVDPLEAARGTDDAPEADGAVVATAPASVASRTVARRLTAVEQRAAQPSGDGAPSLAPQSPVPRPESHAPVLGITGTGGAGKSTLTDELVRRVLNDFDDVHVAVLSVDPTRRRTGGALLGDRIRMNSLTGEHADRVYMRSFATRQAHRATSGALREAIDVCRAAGFDLVIVETAGIGQSDTEVAELVDVSLYVMTSDFGAPTQLEKIGMLDVADLVALNKFEKRGAEDALRDVKKQVQRNRGQFSTPPDEMPVYPTMAAQFNDPGVSRLYLALLDQLREHGFDRASSLFDAETLPALDPSELAVIPPSRQRYLAEIAETCRSYRDWAEAEMATARKWGQAAGAKAQVESWAPEDREQIAGRLDEMAAHWWGRLDPRSRAILDNWDAVAEQYADDELVYRVRGRDIRQPLTRETLSGTKVPRVALPRTEDPGERLRYALLENLPGHFPFTAGVFPLKREGEDPTRMFAGEGTPERTNKRFHLVSLGMPAKRLSTAFDSVTLYGRDPDPRPDVYGKVGTSGVSIATLDDMKKLYSGFDLCAPTTSVSMTINGPAPTILAMFFNTAIDQQVEQVLKAEGRWDEAEARIAEELGDDRPRYIPYVPDSADLDAEAGLPEGHDGSGLGLLGTSGRELVAWGLLSEDEYQEIRAKALTSVRGTVQADILKEDQAQNTCIFSTEFSLRCMADVQEAFIDHGVRNFYSVSISGYHIAEAGANPISQLAFTLANGFTYVEAYRARGMDVDAFAPNLSFFFSNGMDAEYAVIGRVARRIWSVAMRELYGASDRSQKLKYHVQTSGRSLHAQEIQFNDIRTTLQALLAIYDNCNSLHTNAYDEAITTPTEESVRRAMAIQLIINRELGLAQNENPIQGAYIIDELTDLVEEAVLLEFERISDRGGVLGAMESMYQRGKIQEESMLYEHRKHTGELPVIGVNTFLPAEGAESQSEVELMRGTEAEKQRQLNGLDRFHRRHEAEAPAALAALQRVAREGGNTFEALLETVRVASLGQITVALFEVGGQYRRSM
ncbi:methylmalonyl-CoA mutase family protein [Rubrivirga marina]|uniref:Fused isobutyryl-CoA mutase n=1 Tax=Rubrivirga marina TaxID=1196024 RepID=A0A271J6I5_9BACT|nr:methylmalonyl-CoA mutase family protein [Rubrivirga marina]PAP78259.1 methylmalonyl-CoA mutase [Rubrivirga marina]